MYCCHKQKDIMEDSISVPYRIYMDKLTVQQTAAKCELISSKTELTYKHSL